VRKPLRELLEECSGGYYDLFDYLRKVKIDSRQITTDYGSHAAFDLNSRCGPITKSGGKVFLDELPYDYGFDCVNELWEHLTTYKPKYKLARELAEYYLDEWEDPW
jgi:hypothetical protein